MAYRSSGFVPTIGSRSIHPFVTCYNFDQKSCLKFLSYPSHRFPFPFPRALLLAQSQTLFGERGKGMTTLPVHARTGRPGLACRSVSRPFSELPRTCVTNRRPNKLLRQRAGPRRGRAVYCACSTERYNRIGVQTIPSLNNAFSLKNFQLTN